MKRSLLLSSLASAALLAPVIVLAQPPDGPPPGAQMNRQNPRRGGQAQAPADGAMRDRRPRRGDLRAALGLTEAQQAEIRKNREASRRSRLLKTTDLKVARMDLASLMRAETVDEKAVAAKLAEVQAAQGALLKLRVDSTLALRKILTPEQRKQMSELRRGRPRARGPAGMNRRMNAPGSRGMSPGRRGMRGRPAPPPRGNPAEVSDLDLDFFDLEAGDPLLPIGEDTR